MHGSAGPMGGSKRVLGTKPLQEQGLLPAEPSSSCFSFSFFLVFFFLFVCFETGSHVVPAGLNLAIQLQMT